MHCRQLCLFLNQINRYRAARSIPAVLQPAVKASRGSTLPTGQLHATLKRPTILRWMLGLLGKSGLIRTVREGTDNAGTHVDLVDAAAMLYLQCANGVDYLNFIEKYHMPDTFMSWFKITVLHIWMVLLRLTGTATVQAVVKQEMVYCLWDDVDGRLAQLKRISPSVSVKRRETLGECYGLLLISFCEYDEVSSGNTVGLSKNITFQGILGDDKTLAGALWRNMYNRELVDPVVLSNLVRYVRFQVIPFFPIVTDVQLQLAL
ncbi:hypothetical protein M513_13693 [Trichuris suis]|uniref:Ubiquinol-cytochrome c chaperone domain-containing protein n=1 Tax=Trichuris suis TaxID=68888 RepID=A0A085LKD6_9BILA|nr:hypothetical protein M513_13693 [Trichuris suis]